MGIDIVGNPQICDGVDALLSTVAAALPNSPVSFVLREGDVSRYLMRRTREPSLAFSSVVDSKLKLVTHKWEPLTEMA